MRIDDWKKVLQWQTVPTFGEIHKLPPAQFKAFFYLPTNVREVLDTIKKSLQEGYGITNKHIVGEPGCGKTTFVYFIKKVLSRDTPTFRDFAFHILHINRLLADADQKELIEKRVLRILSEFYEENGLEHEYHTLVKGESIRKEQINKLEDFIRDEQSRFSKRLILIVDDIDETDEADVEASLRYFYSLLECHQICKWLVVRNTTLDHYKARLLDFIETKFGPSVPFPRVDLHGIVETRINAANPDGVNPITRDLCVRLLQTFNFDLRQAVAGVQHFFEEVDALEDQNYSGSFIGQYLSKNFTRAMTAARVFPDIYYNAQLRYVPLEKDVFQIISLYNQFPRQYLDVLTEHYRRSYENLAGGRYAAESYLINFDMKHVNTAIQYLVNQRLVEMRGTGAEDCRLTYRGEAFAQFVAERLYTEYCKQECERDRRQRHPMFWRLAKQFLSV